jgi:U3 small nucleolar RNA-associated protein 22
MAPPATKRRKLQHPKEAGSDGGDFSDLESQASDSNTEEKGESAPDGQISMPDARAHTRTEPPKHSLKRREDGRQDGIYTAEVFKSNVFKLQVDELLQQVKLKYGKKEAPAETAMRTLKSLIEQLPSREPLSVRLEFLYIIRSI